MECGRDIYTTYRSFGGDARVLSVTDSSGSVTGDVGLLFRSAINADASGVTTRTSFDIAGRATTVSSTSGGVYSTLGYAYGDDGQVATQSLDNQLVASMSYDGNGELPGISYPFGGTSGSRQLIVSRSEGSGFTHRLPTMRYVVIMAGGAGTRLWPLSRNGMPKQLLTLIEGKSLLRIAYERVAGAVPDENILVCAGASYLDAVAEQLPELPTANLLGEPVGRDSLNAVAWPAAVLAARDPEAVVATLTADHVIRPIPAFQAALDEAYRAAETDPLALVTFGVVPTGPHTGFGYLKRGAQVEGLPETYVVEEFKEKPDQATAVTYVDSGDYWWNSGMFVWRAQTLLDQLKVLQPVTYVGALELAAHPDELNRIYPTLPKNSVDFAVMEPVSNGLASAHVLAVRLPIEWYDVGSYAALAEHLAELDGNAVEGNVVSLDSSGNVILNRGGDGALVAVVGLTDTVVVTAAGITLVCPKDRAEDVKKLVAEVTRTAGDTYA